MDFVLNAMFGINNRHKTFLVPNEKGIESLMEKNMKGCWKTLEEK